MGKRVFMFIKVKRKNGAVGKFDISSKQFYFQYSKYDVKAMHKAQLVKLQLVNFYKYMLRETGKNF